MATPNIELPVIGAERLDWPAFSARFRRRFHQGDAVTLLGGPGTGKTHLAILVAEMRAWSFFMATKPRDPLILQLHQRGWAISQQLDAMEQYVEVHDRQGRTVRNPDGTIKLVPLYPRFVYWPVPTPLQNATLEQEADYKRATVQASLVVIKKHGSWCLVLDETNYLTDTLRLRRELSELWHTARSNRVSVIANAQRPSWIPRAAIDNPNHFFIFQASDQQELKRLGEITGGLDWKPMAGEIATLNWRKHEFLYVSSKDRVFMRSVAPDWSTVDTNR